MCTRDEIALDLDGAFIIIDHLSQEMAGFIYLDEAAYRICYVQNPCINLSNPNFACRLFILFNLLRSPTFFGPLRRLTCSLIFFSPFFACSLDLCARWRSLVSHYWLVEPSAEPVYIYVRRSHTLVT